MNEQLKELEDKIRTYTQELFDLTDVIRILDKEIIDADLRKESTKDLKIQFFDVADRYEDVCKKTETLLELLFKESVQLKEPINIVFIKLHKRIKESNVKR